MKFEFYHAGIDKVPKLSVDGTVANSVHFSHWQGNETPAEVKADTSTEIALNLRGSFVSLPMREMNTVCKETKLPRKLRLILQRKSLLTWLPRQTGKERFPLKYQP